jgi:4-hydroxybenzoate polyprenyltransferase/geranylgeranylglycerol-phosphate geranylgeranyltransferase
VVKTHNTEYSIKNGIFAHLETWRPYTIFWSGLVSLTGACVVFGDLPPLKTAFLVFIIPIFGWIAGLYASDYIDKELDRIEKPHRPIPSGRLKSSHAVISASFFAACGLILSSLLTVQNILMVFAVAFTVLFYAKITKPRGMIGNFTRGFATVLTFFFGVVAITNSIPLYVWLLSLVFFMHDTNSNLVGSLRDRVGDKKGGYRTIPVVYGIKTTMLISFVLSCFYIGLLLLLIISFNFLTYPVRFSIMFILPVAFLCSMFIYMLTTMSRLNRKKALAAHEFLIAERITLASALIFGMVTSLTFAIVLFVITLSITLISQHLIRKRYEFTEIT